MNNRKLRITVTAIALSLLPGLALADVKVSFKLQGGWAYISAGDVNPGTQAFFDWGKIYFGPPSGGLIEGGFAPIHQGYELGGDIIFELSRTVGIGIGAGYLQISRKLPYDMMEIIDNPQGGGLIKYFIADTKLSAIPMRLGIYLTFPISSKFYFAVNAGLSCYLKTRYFGLWVVGVRYDLGIPEHPAQLLSTTAEKKNAPFGFQGGVGIEYKIMRKIAVFVETQGRYGRFRGLKGTSTSEPGEYGGVLPSFSENGKLYYESVPMLPYAPRLIMVQSAPPPGPGGEARLAAVDFSGISLQAGIRVRF